MNNKYLLIATSLLSIYLTDTQKDMALPLLGSGPTWVLEKITVQDAVTGDRNGVRDYIHYIGAQRPHPDDLVPQEDSQKFQKMVLEVHGDYNGK